MRKRGFSDFTGVTGLFRNPVAKCGTEAVDGIGQLEIAHDLHQRHVRDRADQGLAWEDQVGAGCGERLGAFEDADSLRWKGNEMRASHLHAVRGHGPHTTGEVDFLPCSPANLARPSRGEDQRFQRDAADGHALAKARNECRHISIGHASKMAVLARLARQALGKRAHRRLALAITLT